MSEPSSSNPPPKTVFIIGAGASNEVGLPIGSELKATIARALDIQFEEFNRRVSGDGYILEALELAANNDLKYLSLLHQASVRIYDAMPQAGSIDTFLDIHNLDKEIELCGKLAIVRTILQAESKSTLFMPFFSNKPMDFESLEDTWFNNFFRLVLGNCRPSDLEKRLSSVALVIFNYDRCIEHYLYHALQKHHFMHESDVASLLRKLEIYHPYGTVGSLPWLAQSNAIAFGDTPSPKKLLALASQIKTFTEATDDLSDDVKSIRLKIKSSQRLVFLGFAFHHLNVDLLLPSSFPAEMFSRRQIFATAYGISESDAKAIAVELESKSGIPVGNIHVRSKLQCGGLLKEYSRGISFAR